MTERNVPAGDPGWLPDAPATGFLLGRGQIERVEANPAHARTILEQARMHLSSARILAVTEDTAAAFRNCIRRCAEVAVRHARRPGAARPYQPRTTVPSEPEPLDAAA
ncbi:MAG TPA: hypothetical protein VFQ44_17425 [Streptosporangiaceae bacterium]|nr:hypothetical protein [Streptosporangiaceae bacterium]